MALGDARDEVVVPKTVVCSDVSDEALRYITSFMFSALNFLEERNKLYMLKEEVFQDLAEVSKLRLESCTLSVVF